MGNVLEGEGGSNEHPGADVLTKRVFLESIIPIPSASVL